MNIFTFISDKQYEWMINNLPFKLMYKKVLVGRYHVWILRWGLTKKQIKDAEERAQKNYGNIIWDKKKAEN